MLVLSRRLGEGILIGDAYVKVVDISAGSVKLEFDAPEEMTILREELVEFELTGVEVPKSVA